MLIGYQLIRIGKNYVSRVQEAYHKESIHKYLTFNFRVKVIASLKTCRSSAILTPCFSELKVSLVNV